MGCIYIMTNPSFPKYVKIGWTDKSAKKRLKDANDSTWTPFAFRLYGTYETSKNRADTLLHSMIEKLNSNIRATDTVNGKLREREFFELSPEDAFSILEDIAKVSDTESKLWRNTEWTAEEKLEDIQVTQDNSKTRSTSNNKRYNFKKYGIEIGEKVYFKYDQKIVATVAEKDNIEYKGKIYSLTSLAKEILENNYQYHWKKYQGSAFWTYKGKTLSDIKQEYDKGIKKVS